MTRRYSVGIVGATGIAGQQFVVALARHPWFTLRRLAASERSAGKRFGEALRDPHTGARRWWCDEEPSPEVLSIPVENGDAFDPSDLDVVFSATESEVAQVQEPRFAKTTAVVSTASAFRSEADVPLLVPNVNMAHAASSISSGRTAAGAASWSPSPTAPPWRSEERRVGKECRL